MFAIVEIMGHRTRAGVISDAQLGGAALLRIEHPTATAGVDGTESLVEFYAPQAIFAIRPCTRDEAIETAGWAWPIRVPTAPALSAPFKELVDDDLDDDLDD